MMIEIEINRYTIIKLEEVIEKYNKINNYHLHDYVEIINAALDFYLKEIESK